MIPEIALFLLILTGFFALLGVLFPLLATVKNSPQLRKYTWPLTYGAAVSVTLSISLLAYSFLVDDFSVLYIAQHSNSQLPAFFKIAAVWGGHEGSLLFWVFSLALWAFAIAVINRRRKGQFISHVLVVMNLLILAFVLLTLFTSNPFLRLLPMPFEGRDLNPMLQDVGLIFHPPLLYLGYVGFSGVFAFAAAALCQPQSTFPWAKQSRGWALLAWTFLTAGIALGAWWAYYELGWGGWWFWDPVENASLLPWLTGTALLHSLTASEKRHALIRWSLLLAVFTFCLSILGTFVVRSGVLTSVHAFAVDPTKGLLLLLLLALCLVVPLTLFANNYGRFKVGRLRSFYSREVLFLALNSLFAVTTLTVLLGTFYPMIFDAFNLGKISVGAPYFNALFVPLTLLAFLLMGCAAFINWGKSKLDKKRLTGALILSLLAALLIFYLLTEGTDTLVILVLLSTSWVIITPFFKLHFIKRLFKNSAMTIAHTGIAITAIGAALNAHNSSEISSKMGPGTQVVLGELSIEYIETQWVIGPNYSAEQALLFITDQHNKDYQLTPQRRHYPVRVMNMSEPAIKSLWNKDIYITLGEKIDATDYAVRIQKRAFTNWIWLGTVLMIIGGLFALLKRFPPLSRRNGENDEQ
ncbi:heme lyase CcmF/NrfE family subunit [Psychromonas ossibalaenae]|uniref:heme lyase CcmF/NrfE family subunit n=1 Tax=Psychromonas ossibalaenae TaxID=444922 RepID=UPI00035C632F|nr:heme lyase CcmF/NrfE family subunit [Psychromonas ossibalaenae]